RGRLCDLDAAGLPATAGVDLRLDHDGPAECPRGGLRLFMRRRETTLGDGDTGAREELLRLVFVELHGGGTEDIVALRETRFGRRFDGNREDDVRSRADIDPRRAARRMRRALLGAGLADGGTRDVPRAHRRGDLG